MEKEKTKFDQLFTWSHYIKKKKIDCCDFQAGTHNR